VRNRQNHGTIHNAHLTAAGPCRRNSIALFSLGSFLFMGSKSMMLATSAETPLLSIFYKKSPPSENYFVHFRQSHFIASGKDAAAVSSCVHSPPHSPI
jgi:hypothetical protein